MQQPENELDLVWGAKAIGKEINLTERKTYYLLETGKLPGKKVGKTWVSSRPALKQRFAELLIAG